MMNTEFSDVENELVRYRIIGRRNDSYTFEDDQKVELEAFASSFPAVYKLDVPDNAHTTPKGIVFKFLEEGQDIFDEVSFDIASKEEYVMDYGQTNIVFCTGKAAGSKTHLKLTTDVSELRGLLS